jgi:hypothetical protein
VNGHQRFSGQQQALFEKHPQISLNKKNLGSRERSSAAFIAAFLINSVSLFRAAAAVAAEEERAEIISVNKIPIYSYLFDCSEPKEEEEESPSSPTERKKTYKVKRNPS